MGCIQHVGRNLDQHLIWGFGHERILRAVTCGRIWNSIEERQSPILTLELTAHMVSFCWKMGWRRDQCHTVPSGVRRYTEAGETVLTSYLNRNKKQNKIPFSPYQPGVLLPSPLL